MNKFLLLLSVLIAFKTTAQTVFQKAYGDNTPNKAYGVVVLEDTSFVISGQTGSLQKDLMLMKTDKNGQLLWSKSYGTAGSEEGRVCQKTTDGGFLLSGYTNTSSMEALLLKTDSEGNLLWAQTYGGAGNDFAWSMSQSSNGNVYLSGWSASTAFGGDFDAFVIKTNFDGDTLWTKMLGASGADYFRAVCATTDGGCAAVGESDSWSNNFNMMAVRLAANGDTVWTKVFGTVADLDFAWSIQQTPDGGFIVGGNSGTDMNTGDALVYKLAANGTVQWAKMIGDGSTSLNTCRSIQVSSSGNYLLSGYTGFSSGDEDGLIMMLDADGNTLWSKKYAPGIEKEHIRFITEISENDYLAVGYTPSVGAGNEDVYLLHINDSGFSGGCFESATGFNNLNHSLPVVSGIGVQTTGFTVGSISGSGLLNFTTTEICDSVLTSTKVENSVADLLIFPNPASNEVKIVWNTKENPQISTVSITNLMGQVVYTNPISNNQEGEITVNASSLTDGVYLIELEGSGGKSVKKIVIQH